MVSSSVLYFVCNQKCADNLLCHENIDFLGHLSQTPCLQLLDKLFYLLKMNNMYNILSYLLNTEFTLK